MKLPKNYEADRKRLISSLPAGKFFHLKTILCCGHRGGYWSHRPSYFARRVALKSKAVHSWCQAGRTSLQKPASYFLTLKHEFLTPFCCFAVHQPTMAVTSRHNSRKKIPKVANTFSTRWVWGFLALSQLNWC